MVLMMHYSPSITSLASPDPILIAFRTLAFGALSPTKLWVHPLKMSLSAPSPSAPLTHCVRSKSSSLAYRLAFVIYMYVYSFIFGLFVCVFHLIMLVTNELTKSQQACKRRFPLFEKLAGL